jgi:hypothetical protein
MREGVYFPGNFFYQPRIAALSAELKLLDAALWPEANCAGIAQVEIRSFSCLVRLSTDVVSDGLSVLSEKGLVSFDEATGELFICDYLRFQKFNNSLTYNMLLKAVDKIESDTMRDLVRSKIPPAPAPAPAPSSSGSTPAASKSKSVQDDVDTQTGVIVRTNEDRQQLTALVKKHGIKKIKSCAEKIRKDGEKRPFISSIVTSLKSKRGGLDEEFDPSNIKQNGIQKI